MNPKEKDIEHYEAVTLCSGKELEDPKKEDVDAKELDELVEK